MQGRFPYCTLFHNYVCQDYKLEFDVKSKDLPEAFDCICGSALCRKRRNETKRSTMKDKQQKTKKRHSALTKMMAAVDTSK